MENAGEMMIKVMTALGGIEFIVTVGQMLLWIAGWYMVARLWRLRWALIIMWGDVTDFGLLLYQSRHRFIGYPETPMSPTAGIVEIVLIQIISLLSLVLITAGAAQGVGFLRRKWQQRTANHTSEGIRQPADGLPKPSM